jgi:hypothetical protein
MSHFDAFVGRGPPVPSVEVVPEGLHRVPPSPAQSSPCCVPAGVLALRAPRRSCARKSPPPPPRLLAMCWCAIVSFLPVPPSRTHLSHALPVISQGMGPLPSTTGTGAPGFMSHLSADLLAGNQQFLAQQDAVLTLLFNNADRNGNLQVDPTEFDTVLVGAPADCVPFRCPRCLAQEAMFCFAAGVVRRVQPRRVRGGTCARNVWGQAARCHEPVRRATPSHACGCGCVSM